MDMNLFIIMTMIVLTTAVSFWGINGIVSKVLEHKRWQAGMSGEERTNSSRFVEVAERTDMIEDRLRVLERLATDRGVLLSDEIEALRDVRVESGREKEAH